MRSVAWNFLLHVLMIAGCGVDSDAAAATSGICCQDSFSNIVSGTINGGRTVTLTTHMIYS